MYLLMNGLRIKGKLSSKKLEMLYKLARGMCTAAVGRRHSVNESMIHYIHRNEGKTWGSIRDNASSE